MASGDRDLILPRTLEQMETELCPRLLEAGDKLKTVVRKCLDPFPKTVAGMLLRGNRNVIKTNCRNSESEKNAVIENFVCIRNQSRLDQLHDVVDLFNRKLVFIGSDDSATSRRLDLTCCHAQVLMKELREKLEEWDDCKEEGTTWIMNFIDEMLRDALDLACSTYQNDPNKCKPVLEETPLNITMQSAKNNDAFFVPLIRVLSAIS